MSDTDPMTAEYAMNALIIPLYAPEGYQHLKDIFENRIAAINNAIADVHVLSSTQSRGHEGSKRVGWRFHRLQIKRRYEDSRSTARDAELEALNEINHHLVSLRKLLSHVKNGAGTRDEAVGKIRNMYAHLEPGNHWGPRPRDLLVKRIWKPIIDETLAGKGYRVQNEIASISKTSLGSCSDEVPCAATSIANEDGFTAANSNAGSSVQRDGASTRSGRSRGSSSASSHATSVFSLANSHSSIASSIHSWFSGLRK